jgi:Zn-finger nucleic acid-binding protein
MELSAARGYFFCRYCGSFHFPESVGDDGIRIVGKTGPALSCCVCKAPLEAAVLDGGFAVSYCRNCRGVLMPRPTFATVIARRRAWTTDPPGPPVPLNRKELERRVICPACRTEMATHPYYGPGNVVIDTCGQCELLWVDFGELKQIVAAPGRDRGTREQVLRDEADTVAGRAAPDPDELSDTKSIDVLDLVWRLFR